MSVLVILTPGFPKDETDTTCLPAFQQFALSLKKLRPAEKYVIISFQYPFEKKEYYWQGIRVVALGGNNKPRLRRLLTWIRAYKTLGKIHREIGIHGVFSLWLSECSLVGKIFSKRKKLKHFSWLIGQDAKKSNQYIPRIRPKGEEIVAMSDFLKSEFQKNFHQTPFMVAENGIVEEAFPSLNPALRDIDVLGVGSLTKLKNYEFFIEIVGELQKHKPDLKALIAGVGENEARLKELVASKNLSSNIVFAGLVPHAGVFDLMNRSRIFLHTSHYEGNSTVLMEALYCGCKVFSTCPLSDKPVKNLTILNSKENFAKSILDTFSKTGSPERVIFNTMDNSARKILALYDKF